LIALKKTTNSKFRNFEKNWREFFGFNFFATTAKNGKDIKILLKIEKKKIIKFIIFSGSPYSGQKFLTKQKFKQAAAKFIPFLKIFKHIFQKFLEGFLQF
jgi:hypothetical protein